MSACISRHGEYSAHTVGDDFYCEFCGAFDEQAAVTDAYERGRAEQAAADRARVEAVLGAVRPNDGLLETLLKVRAALDSEDGHQ
jgi:class 3 adenylate cyclase